MPKTMTSEDRAEHLRLHGDLRDAFNHNYEMLVQFGVKSKQYLESEVAVGVILTKMRKLRGEPTSHWASQLARVLTAYLGCPIHLHLGQYHMPQFIPTVNEIKALFATL